VTDAALTELHALDQKALLERWQAVFGQPAPRYSHANFLRSALGWEIQAAATGLSGASRRRIVQALRRPGKSPALSAGTQLLREWNGRAHRVTVLDRGFDYHGTTYRSLSAIARVITGTPWSGPRFFGLRE
jgi:hypothetical protein